jgi:hypothetical protein
MNEVEIEKIACDIVTAHMDKYGGDASALSELQVKIREAVTLAAAPRSEVREALAQAANHIERIRTANELMAAELSGYRAVAALVRGLAKPESQGFEEDVLWRIRRLLIDWER